jgi:hypothetical protein
MKLSQATHSMDDETPMTLMVTSTKHKRAALVWTLIGGEAQTGGGGAGGAPVAVALEASAGSGRPGDAA